MSDPKVKVEEGTEVRSARLVRDKGEGNRLPSPPVGPSSDLFPEVTSQVIRHLNRVFPNKLPDPGPDAEGRLREAWGARKVVEHLEEIFRQQQEQQHVPSVRASSGASGPGSDPTGSDSNLAGIQRSQH